jgi:hypothetical protein
VALRDLSTAPLPRLYVRESTHGGKRTELSDPGNPLHVGHFPPPHGRRRPTCDLLWGTRGPEFKSRRPDQKSPA